jgi:hypothetical protein
LTETLKQQMYLISANQLEECMLMIHWGHKHISLSVSDSPDQNYVWVLSMSQEKALIRTNTEQNSWAAIIPKGMWHGNHVGIIKEHKEKSLVNILQHGGYDITWNRRMCLNEKNQLNKKWVASALQLSECLYHSIYRHKWPFYIAF